MNVTQSGCYFIFCVKTADTKWGRHTSWFKADRFGGDSGEKKGLQGFDPKPGGFHVAPEIVVWTCSRLIPGVNNSSPARCQTGKLFFQLCNWIVDRQQTCWHVFRAMFRANHNSYHLISPVFVMALLLESIRASATTTHANTLTELPDRHTLFFLFCFFFSGTSCWQTSHPPSLSVPRNNWHAPTSLLIKQATHRSEKWAASTTRAGFGHMCPDTFEVLLIRKMQFVQGVWVDRTRLDVLSWLTRFNFRCLSARAATPCEFSLDCFIWIK